MSRKTYAGSYGRNVRSYAIAHPVTGKIKPAMGRALAGYGLFSLSFSFSVILSFNINVSS